MQGHPLFSRPGATRYCDAGSLHRLPATTGAYVLVGIPGGPRFPLEGGGVSPYASDLERGPPWDLSVPVSLLILLCRLLFLLCRLLLCRLLLSLSFRTSFPVSDGFSAGGWGMSSVELSFPSPPSP